MGLKYAEYEKEVEEMKLLEDYWLLNKMNLEQCLRTINFLSYTNQEIATRRYEAIKNYMKL